MMYFNTEKKIVWFFPPSYQIQFTWIKEHLLSDVFSKGKIKLAKSSLLSCNTSTMVEEFTEKCLFSFSLHKFGWNFQEKNPLKHESNSRFLKVASYIPCKGPATPEQTCIGKCFLQDRNFENPSQFVMHSLGIFFLSIFFLSAWSLCSFDEFLATVMVSPVCFPVSWQHHKFCSEGEVGGCN